MTIRTAPDGQHYALCAMCEKRENAGSFDKDRFAAYLVELGWRNVPMWGRWVRLCAQCYQDSTHW